VGNFINRGGNIPTARLLWELADRAEKELSASHPETARPEVLDLEVADGVRLRRDQPEQDIGEDTWFELLEAIGRDHSRETLESWAKGQRQGEYTPDQRGFLTQKARGSSKTRGAEMMRDIFNGKTGTSAQPVDPAYRIGLYIVVPNTDQTHAQPIDRDPRRINRVPSVWNEHCKFGQSRDLDARRRAYENTFRYGTPPGVRFCVVALLSDGDVDAVEKEVLKRRKKHRLENEHSGRLLEWMKPGVPWSDIYEAVEKAVKSRGLDAALQDCVSALEAS
jgi:hypothetical protein